MKGAISLGFRTLSGCFKHFFTLRKLFQNEKKIPLRRVY